jgi:hypothetical protein
MLLEIQAWLSSIIDTPNLLNCQPMFKILWPHDCRRKRRYEVVVVILQIA